MQVSYSMVLLAIVDGRPRVLNLKEISGQYVKLDQAVPAGVVKG